VGNVAKRAAKVREPRTPYDDFTYNRLPRDLQKKLEGVFSKSEPAHSNYLPENTITEGDALELLERVRPNSVDVAVWSPPYFVGKTYESDLSYENWEELLRGAISKHFPAIRPGGFLAINIADILCFRDPSMPRISAENPNRRRSQVTREMVLSAQRKHPEYNRHQLASLLLCSEQTIDRRLHGNNIRGGKYQTQTRIKVVGGFIEECATGAGFYPYDRRVWVKDAAWENSRWASLSYRSVDEFEYVYIFWKPGITKVDRTRLKPEEWSEWGSRGVWAFPSVRANDDHEAKFPAELPRRVIRLLTDPGDLVLDCFMGSGTTAVAALGLQRRFIGIELEPRYVRLATRRIAACYSTLPF
jgi:site-specific DNA-methyltransferase (adenine-specific)